MGREQVAGAIILDRLRERMVSGRFLGHWRPGDRLPSIREIAEAENVDRKTAAAFRANILAKLGTEDTMTLYKRFRGREPKVEPLLKKRGLLAN